MDAVYALTAILFLVLLALLIYRLVSPQQTILTLQNQGPGTAPLPVRSQEEIAQLLAAMPTEWVSYQGMTPPLRLKIRGLSYELSRRNWRKYIDQAGDVPLETVTTMFGSAAAAEGYVIDWEGATYPNGNPIPYSPGDLVILMAKDPHLLEFIRREGQRLSPPWPET
jgi:hypothetical protein